MPRNLIHASAIADHRGLLASPGAILIEGNMIIGVGTPQEVGYPQDAPLTHVHGVVTPSFVNTHTHLDLSAHGNYPPMGSFIAWVEEVVFPIRRASDSISIVAAVENGIALALAGGSRIVGDIAGTTQAAEIVRSSTLLGTSFVEVFGLGQRHLQAITQINGIEETMGVQPHAPYSCCEEVYRAAFASGLPVATHVAETEEEVQCTMEGRGPLVDFATRLGAWDNTVTPWNAHPVDALIRVANHASVLAAHLNYIEDRHIPMLASSNISVAFCPRASAYFGHTGHRWKDMIAAGINVAIGTDSLLCLSTLHRISVLDDMRLLFQRDQGEPRMLFAMATVHGAEALGIDPSLVLLEEGETAGLLAFDGVKGDPLVGILESEVLPRWINVDDSRVAI